MFLNVIKSFLLKKNLNIKLCDVKDESLSSVVTRVGLIVDESFFLNTNAIKQEIIGNGIADENIKIIVYRDSLKENKIHSQPTFSLKSLNINGKFTDQSINEFISSEFDLLISYYNKEKPFLLLLTNNSKAKFKVGFSTVDKRLNHLFINIDLENYKGFIKELFRYLKILNKI
jgi:hypothetical protein